METVPCAKCTNRGAVGVSPARGLASLLFCVALATLGGCADPEALPELSATSPPSGSSGGGTTNKAPSAAFTTSCTALVCSVNGNISSDSDGSISSYSWNFGDGATASGPTTNHNYGAGGSYTIRLTVTDNGGASATGSQTVVVAAGGGGNNPPSAVFSAGCTSLDCNFNASGSSDADGTIAAYQWSFGDGATASGVTTTHRYAAGGSFTVTLTVTDNVGASATTSQTLSVTSSSTTSLDGRAIYNNTCASCHGANATGGSIAKISIVGATAQEITDAINSVKNMSSLKSMPAAEIQAVANYLATLVTGTAVGKVSATWSKISITDASGTTVTTESDPNTGTFLIDGSSFEGVIMARAYFPTDGSVLYGYADGNGVVNVTPLTDEVVRLAAAGGVIDAQCMSYSSSDGCFVPISPETLAVAQAWLALQWADAFEAFGIAGGDAWMNEAFRYQYGADVGMSALIETLPANMAED